MKKQKKQRKDWPKRLGKLCEARELAWEELETLEKNYQDGREIELSLRCLREHLLRISRLVDWLHQTMFAIPVRTMFSVDRMNISRQQYYLTHAAGIELFTAKGLDISSVDDYEVYKHCVYEDDKMVCFIDPNETPDVETVDKKTGHTHIRLRLTCSPEELELKHLRPEQLEFFDKHRPDVPKRMKKN